MTQGFARRASKPQARQPAPYRSSPPTAKLSTFALVGMLPPLSGPPSAARGGNPRVRSRRSSRAHAISCNNRFAQIVRAPARIIWYSPWLMSYLSAVYPQAATVCENSSTEGRLRQPNWEKATDFRTQAAFTVPIIPDGGDPAMHSTVAIKTPCRRHSAAAGPEGAPSHRR